MKTIGGGRHDCYIPASQSDNPHEDVLSQVSRLLLRACEEIFEYFPDFLRTKKSVRVKNIEVGDPLFTEKWACHATMKSGTDETLVTD